MSMRNYSKSMNQPNRIDIKSYENETETIYVKNTILQIGNKIYEIDDEKVEIFFTGKNIPTAIKLNVISQSKTTDLLIPPLNNSVSREHEQDKPSNTLPQRIPQVPQVLTGDEDAKKGLEKVNQSRESKGGQKVKMQATNERVLLPGKKRASVVYLQGKTKYVRKCGDWETLKKASRRMS